MFTLATILAALTAVTTNAPAFIGLGVDIVALFEKGKALITSDTASTAAERAVALAEIETLEAQRDARLEELRQQAPAS